MGMRTSKSQVRHCRVYFDMSQDIHDTTSVACETWVKNRLQVGGGEHRAGERSEGEG